MAHPFLLLRLQWNGLHWTTQVMLTVTYYLTCFVAIGLP